MKKKISIIVVLALALALFAGCGATGDPAEDPKTSDAPPTEKTYTFGNIAYNLADVWNLYSSQTFEYCGDQLGVETVVLDCENDIEKSIACMEQLIQLGVDGISIYPISTEQGVQLIKMANDVGIPCVVENIPIDEAAKAAGVEYVADVACDCELIGYQMVKFISENFESAKVLYVAGELGSGVYEQYKAGVDKAMAEVDNVEFVEIINGPWTTEAGMNSTQDFLNKGGEFDVIFANNGLIAKGCYQALVEAGKENIPILSTGGSDEDIQFLEEGIEFANMTAPVSFQGAKTFLNLYEYIVEGNQPPVYTGLPVVPITSSNMDELVRWDDFAGAYKYIVEERN